MSMQMANLVLLKEAHKTVCREGKRCAEQYLGGRKKNVNIPELHGFFSSKVYVRVIFLCVIPVGFLKQDHHSWTEEMLSLAMFDRKEQRVAQRPATYCDKYS